MHIHSAFLLARVGALLALWVTHQAFSMPVVIGVLMLMGIVTKNSILNAVTRARDAVRHRR